MNRMRQLPALSTTSSSSESEGEMFPLTPEEPPATWETRRNNNGKKWISKQLSMKETRRDATWARRTQQYLRQRALAGRLGAGPDGDCCRGEEDEMDVDREHTARVKSLTDEDFDDLRGSIELGFGFSEEDGGHNLCHALPALDIYFAVNRQLSEPRLWLSPSPVSTPSTASGGSSSSLLESPGPGSPNPYGAGSPSWRICSPGDDPKQVKTRLRHWAQAVACSLMTKAGSGGTPSAAIGGKE